MLWDKLYKPSARLHLFLLGLTRRMTVGARVVLLDGSRVYLIRHTYAPGWHFPGGAVEPGETASTGAARELTEESAYRATGPLEFFGLYHNTLTTNRDHVALFVCRQFETARSFKPNFEIAEFGWFEVGQLPEGATRATRQRLAELLDGAPKSESW